MIGICSYYREYRGKVYTICHINRGDLYPYALDGSGRYPMFRARELEKVKRRREEQPSIEKVAHGE